MKKILLSLTIAALVLSCKSGSNTVSKKEINEIGVTIDLNNVVDDKVLVTVKAPTITSEEIKR